MDHAQQQRPARAAAVAQRDQHRGQGDGEHQDAEPDRSRLVPAVRRRDRRERSAEQGRQGHVRGAGDQEVRRSSTGSGSAGSTGTRSSVGRGIARSPTEYATTRAMLGHRARTPDAHALDDRPGDDQEGQCGQGDQDQHGLVPEEQARGGRRRGRRPGPTARSPRRRYRARNQTASPVAAPAGRRGGCPTTGARGWSWAGRSARSTRTPTRCRRSPNSSRSASPQATSMPTTIATVITTTQKWSSGARPWSARRAALRPA